MGKNCCERTRRDSPIPQTTNIPGKAFLFTGRRFAFSQLKEAEKALYTALKVWPENSAACFVLGNVLTMKDPPQLEQAALCYLKATTKPVHLHDFRAASNVGPEA